MTPKLEVVIQNELDVDVLDENFYLTLLERIVALHKEQSSDC